MTIAILCEAIATFGKKVDKKYRTCPMGIGRSTSLVMATVAVRGGIRLPLDSSDNAKRRMRIGPPADVGCETPLDTGLTRTKAESF